MEENNQRILDFLKNHGLTALATTKGDQPEVSVIDFSETERLEIIFTTLVKYRKYEYLLANPKVAFVFGGDKNITVQYEGYAQELTRDQFTPFKEYHVRKNPIEEKFANLEEARFFKVTPTWIRYSDYNANNFFEITF